MKVWYIIIAILLLGAMNVNAELKIIKTSINLTVNSNNITMVTEEATFTYTIPSPNITNQINQEINLIRDLACNQSFALEYIANCSYYAGRFNECTTTTDTLKLSVNTVENLKKECEAKIGPLDSNLSTCKNERDTVQNTLTSCSSDKGKLDEENKNIKSDRQYYLFYGAVGAALLMWLIFIRIKRPKNPMAGNVGDYVGERPDYSGVRNYK